MSKESLTRQGYKLFYDDDLNSISQAIDNNVHGLTFKQVAMQMWPAMKAESAYSRLKNVIKAGADEKLDLQEVKHLCEVTGRYEPLYWLCDESGHDRPSQRSTEDRQADLMREFNEHVEKLERIQRALLGNAVTSLSSVK